MLQVREHYFDTKPLAQHPDSLSPFDFKTSVGCHVGGKKENDSLVIFYKLSALKYI